MPQPVMLASVATAVPPFVLKQRDVAAAARQGFFRPLSRFRRVPACSQIPAYCSDMRCARSNFILSRSAGRSGPRPISKGRLNLFVDAATKALDSAGVRAADVDTIVTVSSTASRRPVSKRAPLRAWLSRRCRARPRLRPWLRGRRVGLSIASASHNRAPARLCYWSPSKYATLAFRLDELTKANIVATALFGDGAAACVLRAGEAGLAAVEMSGQHTWPDTLDIMGWNVDPQGFGVIFDRAIPPFAEDHVAPAIAGILGRAELSLADVDRFACHPGGSKVIAALERALSLEQGVLEPRAQYLADYGNMSAPTALFVLERLIGAGLPPRTLLTAMGPGFTASCVSLKRAA